MAAAAEPLPLAGVRVLDFTANMSGPYATMMLGDQGADVVKVEPLDGDVIRRMGTGPAELSAYFANLNRSKRSVALDLGRPEAGAARDALFDWADVAVHNLRLPVAERLGIDAASARAGRERLVHVAIVGFGREGPFGGRPAYDHVIQALSGYAGRQADPKTGVPRLVQHGVIDKLTGFATAQAVTTALFARERTGHGRELEICMLDVAVAHLWPDGMMNHTMLAPERVLPDIGSSFRLTPTSDGHISFALATTRQWAGLKRAVGIPEDTPLGGGLMREIVSRLSERSTADVVQLLNDHDVPVAPVVALEELHEHPQLVANEILDEFEHPLLGPLRQANPGVRFDGERAGTLRPAPRLGEHTTEVLSEIGLSDGDVDALVGTGVVLQAERARAVRRTQSEPA